MLIKKNKLPYISDKKLDHLIKYEYNYFLFSKRIIKKKKLKYKYIKYYKLYNLYLYKSLNNTIVTVTTFNKKTIFNTSCGNIGFNGAKRSSKYAYESLFYFISKQCKKKGIKLIQIYFSSIFIDKFLLYKILRKGNLKIFSIINVTPIVFNGCKVTRKRKL